MEIFFQIWGIFAKRTLRQPEEVLVRILEETEYRSRNSKQEKTFECKHPGPRILRNTGRGHT